MKLLETFQLGAHTLQNRMVMAAMTRSRADSNGIVGEMTVAYYAQRASAGLILSEAINISADALGSPLTPGLFNDAQIAAWQKVTAAVHEKGGLIYAQLWHTGRVAHSIDRNGILSGAPSAIAINIEGVKHFTAQGPKDYETPRELTRAEIRQIIADYAQAAKMPSKPDSMASNSTPPMATCRNNSSPIPATSATTNTAAASKTRRALPWKRCRPLLLPLAATKSALKSARCIPMPALPLMIRSPHTIT